MPWARLVCVVAIGLFAWLARPPAALAQAPAATDDPCAPGAAPDACPDPGFRARAMARYRALRLAGITPLAGGLVPGASFSLGVEVRRDRLFRLPIGAAFETRWSVRGYHEYDLRFGRVRGDAYRAELRPFDAAVTSVFSDGALLAPGLSAYVDARQRVYPRVDFFGLGQSSSVAGRSDFGVRGVTIDGVVQWQHNRHVGLSVRAGETALSLESGSNHGVIDTEQRYGPAEAPGLIDQPHYRAIGAAAIVDFRDAPSLPTSGTWAGLAWWHALAHDRPARADFTRMTADVRQFIRLPDAQHVLALRALLSSRLDAHGDPTPFYLQPTLGGSRTLRGFGSYRLRGEAVWAASAEYRWQVHRRVEIAPFLDLGAVADRAGALGGTRPALSPGIGVRARTDERVIARVDLASSREGQRLIVTLSAPF